MGRGSLLVSILGASRGFFTLSGESEVVVQFQEDNESVTDARNGSHEVVDWYVRNYRVGVIAECNRTEDEALKLLLKSTRTAIDADSDVTELPEGITVGEEYVLAPNIDPETYSVTDDTAADVDAADYVLDTDYGTIKFLDTAGYTEPFVVAYEWSPHTAFALHGQEQVFVSALFKGTNLVTGQKVMAEFYRLAMDLTETFKLIQKGFSPLTVRMQSTPDVSQEIDAALGQHGRIILL